MISALTITNLKCFGDLTLETKKLTVLSGLNAAGKSTAVQGLLLIAQAIRSDSSAADVPLNGCLVELGTPGDVIKDGGRAGREVSIGFSEADYWFNWLLKADDRARGLALKTIEITIKQPDARLMSFANLREVISSRDESVRTIQESLTRIRSLVAVSAIRPALSDVFPSPLEADPIHANVGMNGQYAPWWFSQNSDDEIDPLRCHPSDPATSLRRQFAAWAGTLFPGAQANAQHLNRTAFSRLELRMGETDDWRRPMNIGYGLSYAFPILVAGLLAKKGQMLVIDSPEAHLHPAAQSAMGQFLARVSHSGVQLLIETHSDHVINGMRLAIRHELASHDDVVFHFFSRASGQSSRSVVATINSDKSGRLSEWPEGFFDQIERDLAQL